MNKKETTVIANVEITMIIDGDMTSEENKQAIINDICNRINADNTNVKDVKVFLIDKETASDVCEV